MRIFLNIEGLNGECEDDFLQPERGLLELNTNTLCQLFCWCMRVASFLFHKIMHLLRILCTVADKMEWTIQEVSPDLKKGKRCFL